MYALVLGLASTSGMPPPARLPAYVANAGEVADMEGGWSTDGAALAADVDAEGVLP